MSFTPVQAHIHISADNSPPSPYFITTQYLHITKRKKKKGVIKIVCQVDVGVIHTCTCTHTQLWQQFNAFNLFYHHTVLVCYKNKTNGVYKTLTGRSGNNSHLHTWRSLESPGIWTSFPSLCTSCATTPPSLSYHPHPPQATLNHIQSPPDIPSHFHEPSRTPSITIKSLRASPVTHSHSQLSLSRKWQPSLRPVTFTYPPATHNFPQSHPVTLSHPQHTAKPLQYLQVTPHPPVTSCRSARPKACVLVCGAHVVPVFYGAWVSRLNAAAVNHVATLVMAAD